MEPVCQITPVPFLLLATGNPFFKDKKSLVCALTEIVKEAAKIAELIGKEGCLPNFTTELEILNKLIHEPLPEESVLEVMQNHQLSLLVDMNKMEKIKARVPLDLLTSKGHVKELDLLKKIGLEALEAYSNKQWEKLDALVGEQACQARAFMLQNIKLSIEEIEEAKHALIQDNPLSIDVLLLIAIRLLTITRTIEMNQDGYNLKEKTCHKQLFSYTTLNSTPLKSLVNRCQRFLAAESVKRVLVQAEKEKVKNASIDLVKIDKSNRPCLPVYTHLRVILKHGKKNGIPLFLRVDQLTEDWKILRQALYVFEVQNKKYAISKEKKPLTGYAFEGYSKGDNLDCLETVDVKKMILMQAAHHTQYPFTDEDPFRDDPKKKDYEKKGEEMGFTAENPTTFVIQHIGLRTVSNGSIIS